MSIALDPTETYDAAGRRVAPLDVPVVIPGRHDVPGMVPVLCAHCREPIRGIPARTPEHRTFHTACLIRVRTR